MQNSFRFDIIFGGFGGFRRLKFTGNAGTLLILCMQLLYNSITAECGFLTGKEESDLFRFLKKNKQPTKPRAIAFVDYEHWYISYDKMLHRKPDLREWQKMLAEQYDMAEILFFADFSNPALRAEIPRIREISSSIIETQNASPYHRKDYTDFIMLDHIYQRAMFAQDIPVFIIFSGDGHFSSAASFLVNRCKKTVGVYGVRECLSAQLRNTASYAVELPAVSDGFSDYYQYIFRNLKYLELKQDKKQVQYPTFWGTVDAVSNHYHVDKQMTADAMRRLLENRYLYQVDTVLPNNRRNTSPDAPATVTIKRLCVDWKRVMRDNLYDPTV